MGIWLFDGGIPSRYRCAPAKEPCSSEQLLPIGRDRNAGGAPSFNDTTKMVQLHWGATERPLLRVSRLPRLLGQPRRSGDHPLIDPLER